MSGSAPEDYRVEVEEQVWGALERLPETYQEKITSLWRDHLCKHPTLRIPGKLRGLKGVHKGYYEYEVTDKDRLIYWVEEAEHTVYVEYLGPHPEWRHGKRRGF